MGELMTPEMTDDLEAQAATAERQARTRSKANEPEEPTPEPETTVPDTDNFEPPEPEPAPAPEPEPQRAQVSPEVAALQEQVNMLMGMIRQQTTGIPQQPVQQAAPQFEEPTDEQFEEMFRENPVKAARIMAEVTSRRNIDYATQALSQQATFESAVAASVNEARRMFPEVDEEESAFGKAMRAEYGRLAQVDPRNPRIIAEACFRVAAKNPALIRKGPLARSQQGQPPAKTIGAVRPTPSEPRSAAAQISQERRALNRQYGITDADYLARKKFYDERMPFNFGSGGK